MGSDEEDARHLQDLVDRNRDARRLVTSVDRDQVQRQILATLDEIHKVIVAVYDFLGEHMKRAD